MPTTLADLLKPALRKAGITKLPGTTPSTDQYGELIPEMNRMLSSWNLDGYRILSTRIDQFLLISGQMEYEIGPGAAVLDMPRPLKIVAANTIFPTDPAVSQSIAIITNAEEWASIQVKDLPGAPMWYLYYDAAYDSNGRGKIFLYPQPPANYQLELYTWTALQNSFTATTDTIIMGPGYEDAIVNNFAIRVASLYPIETKLGADTRMEAQKSLSLLKQSNARAPMLITEASFMGNSAGMDGLAPYGAWLAGPFANP